jgi:hypothetical protein
MIELNTLLKMGFIQKDDNFILNKYVYNLELQGEIPKTLIYNKKDHIFIYENKEHNFTINEIYSLMDIKVEVEKRGFCYILESQIKNQNVYKIGSTNNLPRRFIQLKSIIPIPVRIYDYLLSPKYKQLESDFKKFFKKKKIKGEWFLLNKKDLFFIEEIKKSLK